MTYTGLLGILEGDVVAIIGCNGKTSLLYALAEENRGGKVLLSTTTHIRRPGPERYDRVVTMPEELGPGVNLAYGGQIGEKLLGPAAEKLRALRPADGVALLECDGSRGLPFKGWAAHEPVVPAETTLTVGVCAVWRVGSLFTGETVHRPALFQLLTGAALGAPVTMAQLAAMVAGPRGMFREARGRRALLINYRGAGRGSAVALAKLLPPEFRQSVSVMIAADLKRGRGERIGAFD